MSDDPVCTCGHVLDEHESGFIARCLVKNCDCRDFEEAQSELEPNE